MTNDVSPRVLNLAWLPGDGIGREVTEAALAAMRAVSEPAGVALAVAEYPIGGAAFDATGDPFPAVTRDGVLAADAVLLGAVGGPAWDTLPPERRPERGLLRLRAALGGFANLRPVAVPDALVERSPLRPEIVRGTDMLIVRELLGGVYFGEPSFVTGDAPEREGVSTMRYQEVEIRRVAEVAFQWAERRRGRVTSIDKANVLAVSRLWRDVVSEVQRTRYPHVDLEHRYVDSAAMDLVLRPTDFDVVLTGNHFGDILSDLAATLPGSLGVLPSASVGGDGPGLFEPIHGSAPSIAGKGIANPMGTILSGALLFDDVGLPELAAALRRGVGAALGQGIVPADLGGTATTDAVARAVIDHATA